MNEKKPQLQRSITLPFITLYGVGTIIGAGIYVLVGKVALLSGMFAPLAFLIAAFIAAATGLSYAELSGRYPYSAGEAAYVLAGLQRRSLSSIVGYLVVITGVVSAATITRGFVGYFEIFYPAPVWMVILGTIAVMWALASWGVKASVGVATMITVLEIGGLFYVISLTGGSLGNLSERWQEIFLPTSLTDGYQIVIGAFLAFYAFIGFEDMVNMAEEVKSPRKTLPIGIILALIISTFLYGLVALVAVLAMPIQDLIASDAPLADLVSHKGALATKSMAAIGMITIINGALVQIIMASRVLYGMGEQGIGPKILSQVNSWTQTPLLATALVSLIILVLALWFPVVTLARGTTFVILFVFALVNLSLIRLKIRDKTRPDSFWIPVFVPIIGFCLCLALLILQSYQWFFLLTTPVIAE